MGKAKGRPGKVENGEALDIRRLGPIDALTIRPRDLTVLVGGQATGKSLVAQLLYFFRGLEEHVRRRFRFSPEAPTNEDAQNELLKDILDDLRGVPFGYFANGTAGLRYSAGEIDWKLSVYQGNRRVRGDRWLSSAMMSWIERWSKEPATLGTPLRPQIFIPTERSSFTRLISKEPRVLFADYQPLPMREFANALQAALQRYSSLARRSSPLHPLQTAALKGEAYVPASGPKMWKWRVKNGGGNKIIPIEAVASGQAEAWPFFVIAETIEAGSEVVDLYFEEPETHLHPRAQVELLLAVVALVELGHRVTLTTHSAYLLYVINNLLQRHVAGIGLGHEPAIDPRRVCALRLGAAPKEILDHDGTGLIDAEELDGVADDLGREFDQLLDGRKDGK